MAYDSKGFRMVRSGIFNEFVLDTVDTVVTATGANFITDGTSSTTNGTPGKGAQIGDVVLIRVVGAVPVNGQPPATNTDQAWAFVSAVNTTTGAISLTAT